MLVGVALPEVADDEARAAVAADADVLGEADVDQHVVRVGTGALERDVRLAKDRDQVGVVRVRDVVLVGIGAVEIAAGGGGGGAARLLAVDAGHDLDRRVVRRHVDRVLDVLEAALLEQPGVAVPGRLLRSRQLQRVPRRGPQPEVDVRMLRPGRLGRRLADDQGMRAPAVRIRDAPRPRRRVDRPLAVGEGGRGGQDEADRG